jgi:membrane fusion protein, multidrug efflux system
MEETHQGHLGAMGHEQNPIPIPPSPVAVPKGQESRAKAALAVEAANEVSPVAARDRAAPPDRRAAPNGSPGAPPEMLSEPSKPEPQSRHWRKWLLLAGTVVGLTLAGYFFLVPWVVTALNTVSTDDAYINGHVTFVAPRVAGHVSHVLVDDNYRVKEGDILVELDPEPYRVQVAIKRAAVKAAETDLAAAQAQVRGQVAQARANRFKLEHVIEDVDNRIAVLRAAVATLNSRKAALTLAQANLKRGEQLLPQAAISREDVDLRRETSKVAEANVEQALQGVYSIRVGLGLPAQPLSGQALAEVPPDLDQNFSAVREALGELLQSAAAFGYFPTSWTATPKEVVAAFHKQDPTGDLNRIFAHLIPVAPAIQQAEAKLQQAQSDLDQAKLYLRYCTIVSDIDGVVTGRNVNPGNNVQVGQSLMAVRSIKEIWIDANFKETQLADLRIGQPVRCDVDMYGKWHAFEGRITGFTMGTGQTLALLPPENATGNFVKIVQRLPVRIELTDYNPDKTPLFVGLSVVPYVYYKKPPTGPHAGDVLQPLARLPTGPVAPKP